MERPAEWPIGAEVGTTGSEAKGLHLEGCGTLVPEEGGPWSAQGADLLLRRLFPAVHYVREAVGRPPGGRRGGPPGGRREVASYENFDMGISRKPEMGLNNAVQGEGGPMDQKFR